METRINFWFEGELDASLTYKATEEELLKVLEATRKIINSEDYVADYSDVEFYEEQLDKAFEKVVTDYEEFNYDY